MHLLQQIAWTDLVDVLIVGLVFWAGLAWLRQAQARLALIGMMILGAVFVLARQLELHLTVWIFQGFFAVFVVVVVVVFQEELRRLFERIALWGLRRRPRTVPDDVIDVIARTAAALAESRTGALLVLPGQEPIDRHVEGGVECGAVVSEPLLMSIFDTGSPGHDGAAVVSGKRIVRFAVHLPLSSDASQLEGRGTRHAAALGLAERTDALSIAVSEERGTVSVARAGRLQTLDRPEQLAERMRAFVVGTASPAAGRGSAVGRILGRWREALAGFALAAGLWVLLVWGAAPTEAVRWAPVRIDDLPAGYRVASVEPARIEITLSGPRRGFLLSGERAFGVVVDGGVLEPGPNDIPLSSLFLRYPPSLRPVRLQPERVQIRVDVDTPAGALR